MPEYVSLHNYTCFSIMRSINKPEMLIEAAVQQNMQAVAVTDYNTFAGIHDCYKSAKKTKLIVGCEINFVDDRQPIIDFNNGIIKDKPSLYVRKVILIAKNGNGYRNLLTLNFEAEKCKLNKNSKEDKVATIDWNILEKYKADLICLTGGPTGIVNKYLSDCEPELAEKEALLFYKMFGDDFAFELQPNNIVTDGFDQIAVNQGLYRLHKKTGIKCVAASGATYTKKELSKVRSLVYSIKTHKPFKPKYANRFSPSQYLHTAEDVIAFFKRNFGQEFAEQLCAHSIELANKCEDPKWVSPLYVTGKKNLLPVFPVKDEPCYNDFLAWSQNNDSLVNVKQEDQKYMRYACEKRFHILPKDNIKVYIDRYQEELSVYETLNFSSYMLITSDFLNWGRAHGVRIGPGRGCLVYNTLVLTDCGFKKLGEINIGDYVYTHTGKLQKVTNKFEFDVQNESLLNIKLENSFGDIELTKDHKVYACKRVEIQDGYYEYNCKDKIQRVKKFKQIISSPTWIEANKLEKGDYVFTTFPENKNEEYSEIFDLGEFCDVKENVFDDYIVVKHNVVNEFSIRQISRETNVPFEMIRKLKNGKKIRKIEYIESVINYLKQYDISFDEWVVLPKWTETKVQRFIKLDDEFLFLLGLWVGDGSIRYKQKHGINYAFNINEADSINRVHNYYSNLGFTITSGHNNVNGFSKDIGTTVLSNLFKRLFPNYKNSSKTKHLPAFFRKLSNRQLRCLISGLIESDGCVGENSETIKTTSLQLIKEIKECLNKLQIQAGVCASLANSGKRNNATSYAIRFSGIFVPKFEKNMFENGYYSRISQITKCKHEKVYDITVENDHSYLTSSGVVHNSVGGSLVGYLLNIHQADSIKYGLIFERFLNILKQSYPDCDNDVDSVGREHVINYVTKKYGEDYVASVSNFVCFTPKNALTDVMTCLQIGGSKKEAFRIAKNITDTITNEAKSLAAAAEDSPLLQEFIDKYPEIKEYTEAIIGLPRSYSTHAAGVVISSESLLGLVPLRIDDYGNVCLEYEKYRTEENGLVKIDFLGLESLNIIGNTIEIIKDLGLPPPPEEMDYQQYDEALYNLIGSGDTFGVFQFGTSGGTIELCKKVQPHSLEDLAAITALARPGVPQEVKMSYIARRFGEEEVEIPHENFKKALSETNGLPIFEECFMFLGKDFCGWDLQKADNMRKISKLKAKGKHLLVKLEGEFIEGAMTHSEVDESFAKQIWDEWVVPLSGYAFNKSHSVLYSMTSFHDAYLKAHYFAPFMTSSLISKGKNNSPKAKDEINKFRQEMRSKGVKILSPNVNISEANYKLVNPTTLITGFSALKGVKGPAGQEIVNKRPFKDFDDFLLRVDSKLVHSPVIKALAAVGALDSFGLSRKSMFLYAADLRAKLIAHQKKNTTEKFTYELPKEEWNNGELRALEMHYLGESFTGTKKDSYPILFQNKNINYVKDIEKLDDKEMVICELEVKSIFTFRVKNKESKIFNEECAKLTGEDIYNNQVSLIMFPQAFADFKCKYADVFGNNAKIDKGFGIRISANINRYQGTLSLVVNEIYALMAPLNVPDDKDEKVKIYSKASRKKLMKKTTEDITNDLLLILSK